MSWSIPIVASVVLTCSATALAAEGELVARPLSQTEANYGHLEYVPPGYASSGHKHPVLLFLHGAGEQGDGETNLTGPMTAHGPGKLIAQGNTYFAEHEMLVFIPQSPQWWDPDGIHQFLGYIAANFRVDPRQVYITGLSMGGGGTWSYVGGHPGRATAAVPICGAAGPGDGGPFVGTPVWAFHAWDDPTVTRTNSIGWVDAIADAIAATDVASVLGGYPNAGGDPEQAAATDMTAVFDGSQFAWSDGVDTTGTAELRLTLYPSGGHDSWTRTYDMPAVWDWFVAHRKPSALDDDTYIVDNLDAGASFTGAWSRAETVPGFYWWDQHEAAIAADTVATFSAELPPARYEVFVSWTAAPDRTTAAVLSVAGALEAPAPVTVDMTQGGGFTSIGTYAFEGGTGSVEIRPGDGASGTLVADAVGFVDRGPIDGGDSSGGVVDDSGGIADTGVDASGGLDTSAGAPGSDGGDEGASEGAIDEDGGGAGCGCRSHDARGSLLLAALVLLRRRRR